MPMRSMRTENVRANNLQLVLQTALGADTPLSRAAIAKRVSLTRAGAAHLVDELVANQLLDELPPAPKDGPGRPALRLVGTRARIGVGIDIGVQRIRMVATSLRGEEVARAEHDFNPANPAQVLAQIAARFTELLDELRAGGGKEISGITFSLPGLVSNGVLLNAPNLGWHDVDPAALFAAALPEAIANALRFAVMNEANAAALSAAWQRPGRLGELDTFAYLSGDAGVGAGLISAGKLATGYHGWAGEIGHLTVDPKGPRCRCGSNGCLETYVGARALATPSARPAFPSPAEALGIALAALINLIDVPAIVLGGNLATLLQRQRETIATTVQRRALAARRVNISLQPCTYGSWAAARGASLHALFGVIANPQAPLRLLPAPRGK